MTGSETANAANGPAPRGWRTRVGSFVAGAASASVVLLAFLIPSLQDQWDRYETRRAVDAYVRVGRGLVNEGHYTAAEQAFDRALELAGNHRTDLLELKLQARVGRVNEDPTWLGKVPDDLTESDFLYLLEMQLHRSPAERAATLTAYGTMLAGEKRGAEAERRFEAALAIDEAFGAAHVGLGNLLADRGRTVEAERHYRRAIAIAPDDANAHYDLGLLLASVGKPADAATEFQAAAKLAPAEADVQLRLGEALAAAGRPNAARASLTRARELEPGNAEAREALAELGGTSASSR
jgi:tetratricopeptide (TPR) repeat protein